MSESDVNEAREAKRAPQADGAESNASGGFLNRIYATVGTVGWVFIGLGSFSDASLLLNDMRTEIMSNFTNAYEYETIGSLHVGNTVSFVEEIVGEPQVSRDLGDETSANYIFDDKYLLTLFYREQRVTAYTVLAVQDDFNPEISGLDDAIGGIGEFFYTALPGVPERQVASDSRVASYYIESIDTERLGRFLDLYIGNVIYGVGGTGPNVSAFSKSLVYGSDQEIRAASAKVRSDLRPNLFGRGEVSLEMVEKSLLSTAEFLDYFDPK